MSLASYTALSVTAVAMAQGREDLPGIARVEWASPHGELEESSIEDLLRWLDQGVGMAYVQGPDGRRGPRIVAAGIKPHRYIRSNPDDDTADALLTLPRLQPVARDRRTFRHRWRRRQRPAE